MKTPRTPLPTALPRQQRKAPRLDPRYRVLLACLALLALIVCPQIADLLGPVLANLLR